jgi:environmental stress-induced protein Ves
MCDLSGAVHRGEVRRSGFFSFTGVDRTIRVISGDASNIARDSRKLQKENLAATGREVFVVPTFYQ